MRSKIPVFQPDPMHLSKLVSDFVVYRDPRGCKVTCAARDEVLNVLLSYHDFQRLCQAVVQPNGSAWRWTYDYLGRFMYVRLTQTF